MEHRALKPPIEPLSPRTWQAIEARVFGQLDRLRPSVAPSSGRPLLPLGVAGLALAASVFALVQSWSGQRSQLHGSAPLVSAGTPRTSSPAAPLTDAQGSQLAPVAPPAAPQAASAEPPRHIQTGAAPLDARLGDSRLIVMDQSDVRIEGTDERGWQVRLEHGEVICEVAPRVGRPPFVVAAGDVHVRVVGTRFAVTRRASGTRVQVEAGEVQVEYAGESTTVGPGASWPPVPAPRARASATARPPLDAQREFARAARLEANDPAQALRIYQRIARAPGPWASNALYARARLLLEGGRPREARALLRQYAQRYPDGANAADARRLLESFPDPAEPR